MTFTPLPRIAKLVFFLCFSLALIVPWCLTFSWIIQTALFFAVFFYGLWIALRDVFRVLPCSIESMHFENESWKVMTQEGRAYSVLFGGDSIVSGSVVFLSVIFQESRPFYFPKGILFFPFTDPKTYRRCLLALYDYAAC